MADALTLLGARYSVYVRIVRLILAAKQLSYRFEEVDVFAAGGPGAEYLALNPFGRIPTLIDGQLVIYETRAIVEYLEERRPDPPLLPTSLQGRARCRQICSILDNDAYPHLVWGVYVPEVSRPSPEQSVAQALSKATVVLDVLAEFLGDREYLASTDGVSLADFHALAMFFYFDLAPSGTQMLRRYPTLLAWLDRMRKLARELDADILKAAD